MNSSNLTSDHAAVLVAVTARYLDFVRRLTARLREAHFPLEDRLNEATRLFLPHVEAHAKFLHDLHRWIVSVEELSVSGGRRFGRSSAGNGTATSRRRRMATCFRIPGFDDPAAGCDRLPSR